MIELSDLNCCCVKEMSGLEDYEGEPEKALLDMCKGCSGSERYGRTGPLRDPGGHIIFTGVVYNTENEENYSYVQDFADYLTQNNLGQVVLSEPAFNRLYHPSHKVVVGVWSPNLKALQAWRKTAKIQGAKA